ncbi:hypothetical protein Tco_1135280 [Tanacetum coccineum]
MNQAVVQVGRVDIQTKNAGYGGNANKNAGRYRTQGFNATDENAKTVPSYDVKAVSQVHASSKVHEQVSHGKHKTIIQTTGDDQIDSNIIFDDPFVENNDGTSEHDSIDHDEYREIQMLAYNVQREAENKKRLNNELKKQKDLLQQELETFKDRVKTFESKTVQYSTYKETCDELECELRNDKDLELTKLLEKKAFKEREDRYLDDILDLEEKLSSHDRIIYKIGQSIQTIHMLGKKPNKVYDPFFKAGLGYTNPERLKNFKDAEQSRNKMRHKMVQIDYERLNGFYETFVPQQELSAEHIYFLIPFTSDNGSKSKDVPSESPGPICTTEKQQKHELLKVELEKSASDSRDIQANLLKRIKILENDFQRSQAQSIAFELKLQHQKEKMDCDVSWKAKLSTLHDENVLLKHQVESTVKERENIKLEFQRLFNSIKATRAQHQNEINEMFEDVTQKTYAYADVRAQNQDLLMTISELTSKLKMIDKGKHVNTKFDKSETLGQLLCVTPFNKYIELKAEKCDPACDVDFRFGNDHFAAIIGYGDYVQGNLTICHVYYVEGLGHNLFSVGQLCDGDLEVAF